MSKSRAAEARERKKAQKLEEQQEREDKKRAAESMLGSFSFASSSVSEKTDGQTDSTNTNTTAKRRKGSARAGGQSERRTLSNKDAVLQEDDGAEPDKRLKHAETIIKEYYSTFYEGFKQLVDCCPTVEEQDCRDRKQFTMETAALERFKRNLSRAATRYLLPVLEEQLQDMKDVLPEEEVKALKQKYRHKVSQSAYPTNLSSDEGNAAEGHSSSHESPEDTPKTSNPSTNENDTDKDGLQHDAREVDTSATTDDMVQADHDNEVQDDAQHSLSDRESTPDAERLLVGEIQQAVSMRKCRPSGVHFEASPPSSTINTITQEKDAADAGVVAHEKDEADGDTTMTASETGGGSGEQEEEEAGAGGAGDAGAGVQLADCADAEGAAKLLRKLGLSRLADTSVRCSISAKTLAEVLDSIPEQAFSEAQARSSRPSDSSEKSVAETELSASTQDSLNASHARPAQEAAQEAPAVVFGPSQRPGAGEAAGVLNQEAAGVNQAGALEESEEEEEEESAEACGHCRRCGEVYKLDDPKRIPKLLVCCHTLCAGCARSLSECPWCEHPVLKKEALVEDRLEVERVLGRCDECESGSYAVTACLDCDKRLCHDCNDGHARVALSRDHRVRELAQAIYVPKQFCVTDGHDHGPFEVYCKTCDTILCSKGFMQDHMVFNHEYSWIQQVSDADRKALAEHETDLGLVLKYRDPRNVRRKVVCAEQDRRHLEKHFDDLVALVQALRSDTLGAFSTKVQQDVAALAELKTVSARPTRQAIRYSKAVMIAAAAHSNHAGGVVHHYVLHKTAKDALQRYKESVLDTTQITTSLLLDREEMREGSPLRLFRDRLYQMSASCSEIGNRLLTGSNAVEVEAEQGAEHAQTPGDDDVQSPVLEADKTASSPAQGVPPPGLGLPTPGLGARLKAASGMI